MELRIYRAVSREDGRWVYGWLSRTVLDIAVMRDRLQCRMIAVDPATAGQYIGITDSHGQPIYEGDIIRIGRCSVLFEIRYNPRLARYQAYAQGSPVTRELKAVNSKSYEIVGNIHETK